MKCKLGNKGNCERENRLGCLTCPDRIGDGA